MASASRRYLALGKGLVSAWGCVLRTASASISRSSALVFAGSRGVGFHEVMTVIWDAAGEIKAQHLGDVALFRTGRLVEEEVPIACGGFRILIDGDDDRLDVLIAPAFTRRETARFFQRLQLASQLPDDVQDALLVIEAVRELVETFLKQASAEPLPDNVVSLRN